MQPEPEPELTPKKRHTSPSGRIVLPILFVVLVIVVLGRPILIAGLDDDDGPGPAPAEGSTTPGTGGNDRPRRLADRYPRACLQEVGAPSPGTIAAAFDGGVQAVAPAGQAIFALEAQPPIGWSASGRVLATAGADLWSSTGAHIGLAFANPAQKWAWAPTSDCLAAVTRGRLMVASPPKRTAVLVRGDPDDPVRTFAFSPRGTRLLFAVRDGLFMADLGSGRVTRLQENLGWTLVGWAAEDRPILLSALAGDPSAGWLDFAPGDEVTYCGNEVVTVRDQRLAAFGVNGVPSDIAADQRYRYGSVSCEPGGTLLITVRSLKGDPAGTVVSVLERDGSLVRDLAVPTRIEDGVSWGAGGVVYAGAPSSRGAATVWFVPEGGAPHPTGVRVPGLSDGLDRWLDWSGDRPLGHPTT